MPPSNYREQDFEEHIEQFLMGSGFHRAEPSAYDRELCLIAEEVFSFLQDSQPDEVEKLRNHYGENLQTKLCQRLAAVVRQRGTLDVLRRGFKDHGARFNMAFFKPSSGMNPRHAQLYRANRFSVVRQLRYSTRNENSIDLALFLNGLPILTAELKNSLTGQFVENAIRQYQNDRRPNGEPLLRYQRCLVHFAVGNEKAFMATRLQDRKTRFLPFNRDTENPENPDGHKTAYLWEDIWQPDTLLELIQNYLHVEKKQIKRYDPQRGLVEEEVETFIFPRFHQFDVVRKLLEAVGTDGAGSNYLVQHSAGSGKSNSIAWLAHQLAKFYRDPGDTERLFDSIIVVTDRRVLDRQLQNTIKQFEQVPGVVIKIDKHSAQLQEALETGKAIIVTTLQKFPVISKSITQLKGRRFAVIIDEAHSSQSGESARHLKKTLSVNLEHAEQEDATTDDLEETILEEVRTRGPQSHISYFAFTATPKNKTIELFGTRGPDGIPHAFHTYSMRQAIEERFILDVLKNYTTFKRFFKLVKTVSDDQQYEKNKAVQLLTSYVDLQPHAIETKTRIMLDHFLDRTAHTIQGQGRAMVITRSRLHAVRYYLMFSRIMEEKSLGYKPLVAFSGTVKDPDSGAEYTEKSLNGLEPRVDIPDAFKTPDFRILVVANKFQTGFDEPLLHTMYVDKRLAGVQAVQALSRLNRNRKGKEDPFVLDFVNEAETIQEAFQPYYQATLLEEETDPNRLYDLETELQAYDIHAQQDVEDFAVVFFTENVPLERLQPILDRVVDRWRVRLEDERESFRSTLQRFIRLYGFVSQIITFEDVGLEKLYVFARSLNRKLPRRQNRLPHEIKDAVDLDSFRIQQTYSGSIALETEDGTLTGYGNGASMLVEPEMDLLSNIIQVLNDTYGLNLSEEDRLDIQVIQNRLEADEELMAVMLADNPQDIMRYRFNQVVDNILLEFVNTKLELYKKLTSPQVNELFKDRWFRGYMEQVQRAG